MSRDRTCPRETEGTQRRGRLSYPRCLILNGAWQEGRPQLCCTLLEASGSPKPHVLNAVSPLRKPIVSWEVGWGHKVEQWEGPGKPVGARRAYLHLQDLRDHIEGRRAEGWELSAMKEGLPSHPLCPSACWLLRLPVLSSPPPSSLPGPARPGHPSQSPTSTRQAR